MEASEFEKLVEETVKTMEPIPEITELKKLYSELQEMLETKSFQDFKMCALDKLEKYDNPKNMSNVKAIEKMIKGCCYSKEDATWILSIALKTLEDFERHKKRSIAIGELARKLIAEVKQ